MILVVIGHATYYDIITPFGGIQYGMLMKENGIQDTAFHVLMSEITNFIYTFHMPAFIALSGSLFALGKRMSLKDFIKKKAKRLLIPFFIVWVFWNLPIKYVTGYYSDVTIYQVLKQMLFPSCVYLWYLECLFFVFIIAYFICTLNKKIQLFVVILCWMVGVVIYRKYDQYHFLGDPLYYILWFYVGYRIEDIISLLKGKKLWNFYGAFGMVGIVLALYAGNIVIQNKVIGVVCRYILNPLFMTVAMNYFSRQIKGGEIQQVCSSFGFGIYLYAEPLNYWLLYEINRQMGIAFFGTEIGATIIWLLRIVITPIVAIGITGMLKKLNIKYLY